MSNILFCPSCSSVVEKDMKYCYKCGADLHKNSPETRICPNCHVDLYNKSSYCPNCGLFIADSFRCPICKKELPLDATSCGKCEVKIRKLEEVDKKLTQFKMIKIEGGDIKTQGNKYHVPTFYISNNYITCDLYNNLMNGQSDLNTVISRQCSRIKITNSKLYITDLTRGAAKRFCERLCEIDNKHSYRLPSKLEYLYFLNKMCKDSNIDLKDYYGVNTVWYSDTNHTKRSLGTFLRVCYSLEDEGREE